MVGVTVQPAGAAPGMRWPILLVADSANQIEPSDATVRYLGLLSAVGIEYSVMAPDVVICAIVLARNSVNQKRAVRRGYDVVRIARGGWNRIAGGPRTRRGDALDRVPLLIHEPQIAVRATGDTAAPASRRYCVAGQERASGAHLTDGVQHVGPGRRRRPGRSRRRTPGVRARVGIQSRRRPSSRSRPWGSERDRRVPEQSAGAGGDPVRRTRRRECSYRASRGDLTNLRVIRRKPEVAVRPQRNACRLALWKEAETP